MTEATLEQLPFHELKRICAERGIKTKQTDKKDALVKMIKSGESIHKPRETKRMEILGANVTEEKALPMIPQDIREQLEELAKRGLTWKINHEDCCVTFTRDISTCANLDQASINILRAAQQAFASRIGYLAPAIDRGNEMQAQRLDAGQ